jgi:hypothetical protein
MSDLTKLGVELQGTLPGVTTPPVWRSARLKTNGFVPMVRENAGNGLTGPTTVLTVVEQSNNHADIKITCDLVSMSVSRLHSRVSLFAHFIDFLSILLHPFHPVADAVDPNGRARPMVRRRMFSWSWLIR